MELSKQLDAIEKQFADLLHLLETVAEENRELRQRQNKLQAECQSLRKKNEVASVQLESILQRLRSTIEDKS